MPVEKDSGTILYEYNADIRRPADNLTKVMTILIAAKASIPPLGIYKYYRDRL